MNKLPKILLLLCLASAGFMPLSCSENSSDSDAKTPGKKGKKAEAAGITSDGHDLLVWEEGELDAALIKIDTIQITDSSFDGIAYFKGLRKGKIPEAGDIIASNITKNAPEGFLYKVAGVSMEGNIAMVRIGYASIEDAVEEAEVSQTIELTFDEEGTLQKVLQKSISKTFSPNIPTFEYGNWGTVKTDVSYTITLNVDITIKKFSLKYAKMSVSQTKSLSQIIDLQGKISAEKKFDLASIELSTISFWIGPVPVVITPTLIAQGKITADAEFKVNSKFEINDTSEYGFKYEDGSFHTISNSNTKTNFDFEHSISGDIRFGILVGLELKLYGVLGFHVMAGPALKLSANTKGFFPRNSFDFKNINEKVKLDLGTDMDLGVSIKFKVLFKTIKLLDKSWGPGFSVIRNLKESILLPSFDKLSPSINETFNGITFNSAIQKPDFGFAVNDYGICLEEISSNKCVNGAGIRKSLGAITDAKKYSIPVGFENLKPGTYNVYPYFQSGIGIYYDKAVIATIPDPINIPDIKKLVYEKYRDASASCIPDESNFSLLYDARNGKWYIAVKIGSQTWMAENLNYAASGSVCYDNQESNCTRYGRLYNWYIAMNVGNECHDYCGDKINFPNQGVCPAGWHVPTEGEWNGTLGHYRYIFLKANKGWEWNDADDISGNGKDCYGFNALPGGLRNYDNFRNAGYLGYWWTATENSYLYTPGGIQTSGVATAKSISYNSKTESYLDLSPKGNDYMSIRCLKD